MKEKKVVKIFIFFFAILFAFFSANLYLKKFENNYFTIDHYKYPSIYQEDTISYYFSLSDKIDEDIKIGKKYFESGDVYVNSFLYPRIINLFNSLTNNKKKIFNENTNVIKLENDKIFIYLQILFFFCSVAYLYFTLTQSKLLNKEVIKIFCLITLINPIIFQWHLSFLTESIFLSFLILFISFLIKSKNIYHYLFIGIFIGVMYAQRTIALFYPSLILIYIFFLNEKLIYKLSKFFALLFGLILVITLIGLQNYKRAEIFYFTPTQSKLDIQRYLEIDVIKKSKKISSHNAKKEINKKNQEIKNNNKYDFSNEADLINYLNNIQKNSFNTILKNKLITFQIILKNYLHSMILNPVQTYFGSKYQHWEEYKDSKEHKYWLIFRIIITILFFLFSGIGFIQSLNKIDFKLNAFLISSIFYFLIFGCWISNSRYFVPSILFMGFYFSIFIKNLNFNSLKN